LFKPIINQLQSISQYNGAYMYFISAQLCWKSRLNY